jgi:hypothetical protein
MGPQGRRRLCVILWIGKISLYGRAVTEVYFETKYS